MADQDELNRRLDKGRLDELPPNIPPGFMGEIAPDMRKADEFEPSLNAGIIQESTWETRWLVIVILFALIITSPVAAFLLWRDKRITRWAKVVASIVVLVGYGLLYRFVRF